MTGDSAGSTSERELLERLAAAKNIATTFTGWDGSQQQVSDETLRIILASRGAPAGSRPELEASLAQAMTDRWRQVLPPTVVTREGVPETSVQVHLPFGVSARAWVDLELGGTIELPWNPQPEESAVVDGTDLQCTALALPPDLPLGWHQLHVEAVRSGDGGTRAQAVLAVTPDRLDPVGKIGRAQTWGMMAQLYSTRSARSWGIGDLTDLADLSAVCGEAGSDFVLINPLHAAEPAPPVEDSPYLPATRRFFNPLYIRVEAIPEYSYLPQEQRSGVEDLAAGQQAVNREAGLLDRNAAFAAKLPALRLVFEVPRSPSREQQFQAFVDGEGDGLESFALWSALAASLPADAPQWAEGLNSSFARNAAVELAGDISFYKWLQWICDEQLETAQRAARQAGMGVGIVHDLAVGVHPGGADAWTLRNVLVPEVSVGAPPDMFNQRGQDWSQPPWDPDRLAGTGYAAYRDMLRTILRHAGGVRVDHILGLFRLWWIPRGETPDKGAYVYYDHEALVGILALEAQRAGAVVVGEDLGVFEPWVQGYLAERGILGTAILWFEQTEQGPRPPADYRPGALTTIGTHDLPPAAGYLAGEHVTLRGSLGLLNRPVEEERELDEAARAAILELVRSEGLLSAEEASEAETVEALHRYISRTPSVLIGVGLVDAVGERRTQNQPGTSTEYPNWRIPLAGPDGAPILVEDLATNQRFQSLARIMNESLR
ncbi:4-alpha-glucanotransferase [Arthrobacter sp. Sa2CUA1]|uniref:4-alpha-glucanotransferase n=1 Tax=Arthrobacter gallicola TaxID=2762225 RepID=A0ABR8UWK8_9MICC|nr:4-alpha-glucanotransferase [Arthrobacter gallicola]MBD7996914.1 4-alpha-glucanotransferase [Arthrobacter gallicola]